MKIVLTETLLMTLLHTVIIIHKSVIRNTQLSQPSNQGQHHHHTHSVNFPWEYRILDRILFVTWMSTLKELSLFFCKEFLHSCCDLFISDRKPNKVQNIIVNDLWSGDDARGVRFPVSLIIVSLLHPLVTGHHMFILFKILSSSQMPGADDARY